MKGEKKYGRVEITTSDFEDVIRKKIKATESVERVYSKNLKGRQKRLVAKMLLEYKLGNYEKVIEMNSSNNRNDDI